VLDRGVTGRFRDGDPDAVREVYRVYGGLVYAVAHRILGVSVLAEEAAQQTFVNAWRAAANFDESREMGPWLSVIARRVAIDIHRREAARATDPLDTAPAGDPALVSDATSAEAAYDAWEVRQAVSELPDEEREIVRLQHFEGLTHTEIAARTHVAIGTVKSRSFRAHKRLAGLLGHLRD
jgi:RNA polymerase sigma-70 factor (ECF subfamily)